MFVRASFEIGTHSKDIKSLENLREFFGVGKVSLRKSKDAASFVVTKNYLSNKYNYDSIFF